MKEKLHWPESLVALIAERDINNASLGRAIGVSHVTIGNYVEGQFPKSEHLLALADFFGVTMDSLIGREESRPQMETLHFTPKATERDIESAIAAMDELKQKVIVLDKAIRKLKPKRGVSSTARLSEDQAILKQQGDEYDSQQKK